MALALLSSGCRANTSPDEELVTALETYVRAINAGNPDLVASLYLNSTTVGSIGDGQIYQGWDAIAELLRGFYSQNGAALTAEDVVISPLGQDAAVVYFASQWTVGRETLTTYRGATTIVFARTPDGWRVAHDHTSTLPIGGSNAEAPVFSAPPGGPTQPVRETRRCRVVRVVDGDTVECDPLGRIRLIGVDAPEGAQEPFGSMAKEALEELLPAHGEVDVEADVEDRDRYGRALRYVWSEGVMLNWAMVRNGYAILLTYPPNVQYVDWLRTAQEDAREATLGLWAVGGFDCLPQEYRRGECR
jgi:micrococcal nuclease